MTTDTQLILGQTLHFNGDPFAEGPNAAHHETHGAIATRYKAIAITMMIATFLASWAWGVASFVLIIQAVCMGCAAAYILNRPSGSG